MTEGSYGQMTPDYSRSSVGVSGRVLKYCQPEVTSSWPSLATLILNNEPVYLSQSKLTLKALFPFAKHCHKLSHLGLFLDATSVDESFYQPNLVPFRNLKRLSICVSIIADTESVSLYFSRILPLECNLDSGLTLDEKPI